MAIDVGENTIATTSNGAIHGGRKLRNERDQFLARRRKLQSNGSRSAKHVKETNHIVSQAIVEEAFQMSVKAVIFEDLTNNLSFGFIFPILRSILK